SLTLTAGNFSIGAGNTLTLNGGITYNSNSLIGSATSNLTITGSTATAVTINAITNGLSTLTLSKSVATTFTLGADLTLAGGLTMSASNTLTDGGTARVLSVAGTVANSGTLTLSNAGSSL